MMIKSLLSAHTPISHFPLQASAIPTWEEDTCCRPSRTHSLALHQSPTVALSRCPAHVPHLLHLAMDNPPSVLHLYLDSGAHLSATSIPYFQSSHCTISFHPHLIHVGFIISLLDPLAFDQLIFAFSVTLGAMTLDLIGALVICSLLLHICTPMRLQRGPPAPCFK